MAEKKKKIYLAKEPTTPRRPIILKSDREPPKENVKEKPEKEREKPPTIILKTREQSTLKEERPHSPKPKSSTDMEGVYPSKIAHNEHKEKKEHKPAPPLKEMVEPLKLFDENMDFNHYATDYLSDSNTSYLVVAVIGTQGVGKSLILNLLAQNSYSGDLSNHILQSYGTNKDKSTDTLDVAVLENQIEVLNIDCVPNKGFETSDGDFKFKLQDIELIERGVHCTKGIDMYITSDRVILLDCQPLFATGGENAGVGLAGGCVGAGGGAVEWLQTAAWLMAVSHVLIAVQDWFVDYNFLRYIQAAEMLRPSLSASNSATTNAEGESALSGEANPHLLLLHNRCQLEDFTPEAVNTMQELYRNAFQKSNLQLNSGMYMYSDSNKNGLNVSAVCEGHSVENCGMPINLFLLPEVYSDNDNRDVYRGHPTFEQLAKRLRWMISGVDRHQIANVPNLTERGWYQYCSKAWETIRKCTFFMEYERFLP